MRKGLNRDYVEEYKIKQMGEVFEKRSKSNAHLQMNKNQVMETLMNTFTNKGFL
jgi:hypothetical protein